MTNPMHRPGTWRCPSKGRELDHAALMGDMARKSVVLLGETHDRYDIHRWQLNVAAGLLAHRRDVVLGFEMFPQRVQPVLQQWTSGELNDTQFLDAVEWDQVWGFEPELYLPLFHFCKEFGIPMYALNCRRALVTEVGKQGWEAIPVADRDGVSPAKPATSAYREYLFRIVGGFERPLGSGATSPEDPAFDRFVRAQQTWDRAFACNIASIAEESGAPLVIGIIGRGHLEYGHGTPYQLADLGVFDVAVLLPTDDVHIDTATSTGIADAVFRLSYDPANKATRPRQQDQES